MFFSPDLIRRNQNFALLWIAATHQSKLKKMRSECLNCDIIEACEDVKSHMREGRVLFSLCLTGQLMSGVARIFKEKVTCVLHDAEKAAYVHSAGAHRTNALNDVNLERKKRAARLEDITIEDPVALHKRGRLAPGLLDLDLSAIDLNELVSFDQLDDTQRDRNRARMEDITMKEHDSHLTNIDNQLLEDLAGNDMLEAPTDFERRVQEQLISGQAPDEQLLSEMQALDPHHMFHPSQLNEHNVFASPAQPPAQDMPEQEQTPSVATRAKSQQPQLSMSPVYVADEQAAVPDNQQPSQKVAVEDELPLSLDSVAERQPRPRRVRPRARQGMIVDYQTEITAAQLKQQADTGSGFEDDDEMQNELLQGVRPAPAGMPFAWTPVQMSMNMGSRRLTELLRERLVYLQPVQRDFKQFQKEAPALMEQEEEDDQDLMALLAQEQQSQLEEPASQQPLEEQIMAQTTPTRHNSEPLALDEAADGTVAKAANGKPRRGSRLVDLDENAQSPPPTKAKRTKRKRKGGRLTAAESDDEDERRGAEGRQTESVERMRRAQSAESSLQGNRSSLLPRQMLDEPMDYNDGTNLQPINESQESQLAQSQVGAEQEQQPVTVDDSQVPVLFSSVHTRTVFDKLVALGAFNREVSFSELCPPETRARSTAAKTFHALLVLLKGSLVSARQDQAVVVADNEHIEHAEIHIRLLYASPPNDTPNTAAGTGTLH